MLLFLVTLLSAWGKNTSAPYFYKDRPLIIAHRGACGYLPEHSLQAYQVAAYMGADFIEPDVIVSKEGELIVNHDVVLDGTTNVAELPEFRCLHTTKELYVWYGRANESGWFAEDFTLSQLKQLKLKQRLSNRIKSMDNYFQIPTLKETIEWVINENINRTKVGKELLGAYIELKYPTNYRVLGYNVVSSLMEVLKSYGIDTIKGASEKCPIILQCFEYWPLEELSKQTDLPLIYLMKKGSIPYNIEDYKDTIHGVGPDFSFVFDSNYESTGFVKKAHSLDLAVHPWVIRDDELPSDITVKRFYELSKNEKIDGAFTEFPDSGHYYFN